jgi:hypothetical protein
MLSTKVLQNLLIGFVALLFALGLLWAIVAGIRAGKAAVILKNVAALDQGIRYFQSDQNRYPTVLEFQDRNLMLGYVSGFPPKDILGGPCIQTYSYISPTARTFELAFCLPKAAKGFAKGWNKITQ